MHLCMYMSVCKLVADIHKYLEMQKAKNNPNEARGITESIMNLS